MMEMEKSGECSIASTSVEEQIENSKSHWSLLADSGSGEQEVAEVSNVEEFKALQRNSTWGSFFQTFGFNLNGRYGSMGELMVGKKFAEGGQAKLYEAQVKWWYPEGNEEDVKGLGYVLKVFKKGTFLKHLKSQLPQGLLQFAAEDIENWASPPPKVFPRFYCNIYCGTLLKDGRFVFLIEKEHMDLRSLIESKMKRSGEKCGPFSKEEAEYIMYKVALGVEWLHGHDVVERDLKASNVLVTEFKNSSLKWSCVVADYECSIGVVGTGFFRASEILQACKDWKLSQSQGVFSRAADVYSYKMVCYKILTGKLPFEGHHTNEYDCVLNGQRLVVPKYVEEWTRELLNKCWEVNPRGRPAFGTILNSLLENSAEVRQYDESLKRLYGENFRYWRHVKISQ